MCPDFQWVKAPVFTPTVCKGCMTHKHPAGFVDLLHEDPVAGRLYLCAGCVETAGRQTGMRTRAQYAELADTLDRAESRISQLEAALEDERDNKLVSLADVKELVRQRGGRPPLVA